MSNKKRLNSEDISNLLNCIKTSSSWEEVKDKMKMKNIRSVISISREKFNEDEFKHLRTYKSSDRYQQWKNEEKNALRACITSSRSLEEVRTKMLSMGFNRTLRAVQEAKRIYFPNTFLIGRDIDKGSMPLFPKTKNNSNDKIGVNATVPEAAVFNPPSPPSKSDSNVESLIRDFTESTYNRGYADGYAAAEKHLQEKIYKLLNRM